MQKDKDAINIITIEIEKMKAEGIAFKKDGSLTYLKFKEEQVYLVKIKRLLKNGIGRKVSHPSSLVQQRYCIWMTLWARWW